MMKKILNFVDEFPYITTVAIAVVVSVLVIFLNSGNNFEKNYHKETYTVQHNDTLWSIGNKFVDDSDYILEWIHYVEKENGISATIYSGQKITVFAHN